MQQHLPMAAAVGVELGTLTTTVSIRCGGEESKIRRLDGDTAIKAVFDQVRAAREEAAEPPAPVAFAVPASWEASRRRELADAAERAGLGPAAVVPAHEAAAVYLTERLGHELEPDTALVVFDLGASSCEIAVVGRDGEKHTVEAAVTTGEVSGLEFDQLLLAYLSGRYRDTDPEFWDKVDDPTDPAQALLRTKLLDEIRAARELLSRRHRAGVPLPLGDRDLHLTRAELESCIGELVAKSADLVAATLDAGGVEAAGLMLIGGASGTPIVADRLRQLTGLEPILPDRPETVLAEGAQLIALGRAPIPKPEADLVRRSGRRLGVLAVVLLPLIAATAVFGSELGTGEGPNLHAPDSAAATEDATPTETAAGTGAETDSGGAGGQESSPDPQTPAPDDDEDEPWTPSAPDPGAGDQDEDRTEESTTSGTVPEVTGMSSQQAEQVLGDAGFTNVELKGEQESLIGPWYDDCEVIEQDPPGGDRRPFNDRITITYSYSGTDPSACE